MAIVPVYYAIGRKNIDSRQAKFLLQITKYLSLSNQKNRHPHLQDNLFLPAEKTFHDAKGTKSSFNGCSPKYKHKNYGAFFDNFCPECIVSNNNLYIG